MKLLYREILMVMKIYLREKQQIFWVFVVPLLLLLILGFTMNNSNDMQYSMGVVDRDGFELNYVDFLMPGLIGFSLLFTSLSSMAGSLVYARQQRILRRLTVTPLPKSVFISSWIIFLYVVIILMALFLIMVSRLVFDVQMKGGILSVLVVLTVGSLTFLAFGVALGARIRKIKTATSISQILLISITFLSGVFFPLHMLPGFLEFLVEFIPLTHFINAMRAVFNYGSPLSSIWYELSVLFAWMVACFLIALKTFCWN